MREHIRGASVGPWACAPVAMPALAHTHRFTCATPADIARSDLAGEPEALAEMTARWSATMDAFTSMGIAANPWTNRHDAPRVNHGDPMMPARSRMTTTASTAPKVAGKWRSRRAARPPMQR